MKIFFSTLMVFLLTACASMPKSWEHDSASQQQYQADQAECMSMANSAKSSAIAGASHDINAIYESCMRGRGYYR